MQWIIAGVDGSEGSRRALRWAIGEARLIGARVDAVFAWTYPYPVPVRGHFSDPEWLRQRAESHLELVLDQELADGDEVPVSRRVEEGPAARVLLDATKGGDLLVVGTRGLGGFAGLLLGSVSQQCAAHAVCPVVVVPSDGEREKPPANDPPRLVVGVDGSPNARAALSWALAEARTRQATLDVVHAWHGADDDHPLASAAERARRLVAEELSAVDVSGVGVVNRVVVRDNTAHALLQASRGADLLVVGARGGGGFADLLIGSVSDQAVRHAACPVVVVPTSR